MTVIRGGGAQRSLHPGARLRGRKMARWPKRKRTLTENNEKPIFFSNNHMRKESKIKKLKEKSSSKFNFYYKITRKYFSVMMENSYLEV